MMMIAPTLLPTRRRGFRGRVTGDQRKGGQIGTPTPGADAPAPLYRSGVLDARSRGDHGWWYRVILHRTGQKGLRVRPIL